MQTRDSWCSRRAAVCRWKKECEKSLGQGTDGAAQQERSSCDDGQQTARTVYALLKHGCEYRTSQMLVVKVDTTGDVDGGNRSNCQSPSLVD